MVSVLTWIAGVQDMRQAAVMHFDMARPAQFTLAGLFLLLTTASVALAYSRYVGVWWFAMALGPPIAIGAILHAMIPRHIRYPWLLSREIHHRAPSAIAALTALVLGFAIWIPILLAITL